MNTASDLKTLLPILVDLLEKQDHQCAEYDNPGTNGYNVLEYEENGWNVYIEYHCEAVIYDDPGTYWTAPCSWSEASGEIGNLYIAAYNQDTDEEVEFTDAETADIRKALNNVLREI